MADYDYKKLYALTNKIYKVGLNWADWEGVLEYFASYVKNGKGSVTIRQKDNFEIDIDNLYLIKTWNLDAASVESYRREAFAYDVWAKLEWDNPSEELCVFSDHISKTELLQTDWYKHWLKPIGVSDGVAVQIFEAKHIRIVFKIFHDDSSEAFLDLCRDLAMVTPHLCRAAAIHMKSLGIDSDSEYRNHTTQLKKKYNFTQREVEVATASVYLGTNKKIAEALGISEFTVKKYVKSILDKMELEQKDEIVNKLICFINPSLELIPPMQSEISQQKHHCHLHSTNS